MGGLLISEPTVTVTTVTQLVFKSREDFEAFMKSDEQVKVLGFDEEIRKSKRFRHPVIVDTYRPKIGAVTISTVSYHETGGQNG